MSNDPSDRSANTDTTRIETGAVRLANAPIDIEMRLSEFRLPPVQNALIIGRRAPVSADAMYQALQAMLPGVYRMIRVEHPVVEAVIARASDMRRIAEDVLVQAIVSQGASYMADTDVMDCALTITVTTRFRSGG